MTTTPPTTPTPQSTTGLTMRAAVHREFGGPEVVRVEDVPRPALRPGDLLVRVHASTVSAADHRLRAKDLPRGMAPLAAAVVGARRPRRSILGTDAAGVVTEVGSEVTAFRPGDRVVAMTGFGGGHAEYVRMPATGTVARIPDGLSFEDAAALPFGALTALVFLRRAAVAPGTRVLVVGGSGAVGSMTVQLAHDLGAHVTAVTSGRDADLVRTLGADEVVDREQDDVTRRAARYDVVVECAGRTPVRRLARLLRPGGRLLLVVADLPGMLAAPWHAWRARGRAYSGSPRTTGADMAHVMMLAEAGRLRPVVDRVVDLDDVVAAHRYVDAGRKRGAVVLRIP